MRTKKRISLGSFLKKNNKCLLFIKTRVINNNLSEYTRATAGCEDLLKTYLKNAGYFAGVQLCNINNIVRLLKETYFTYFTALPKYAFFLFISPPFPLLYFICFTGRLYRYKWLFPNIVKVGSMIWCDAKKDPEVVSFLFLQSGFPSPQLISTWVDSKACTCFHVLYITATRFYRLVVFSNPRNRYFHFSPDLHWCVELITGIGTGKTSTWRWSMSPPPSSASSRSLLSGKSLIAVRCSDDHGNNNAGTDNGQLTKQFIPMIHFYRD